MYWYPWMDKTFPNYLVLSNRGSFSTSSIEGICDRDKSRSFLLKNALKSQICVRNRSLKKYPFPPWIVRCTSRTENKADISKLFYQNKLALFYFSLCILVCIKPVEPAICYLLCKDTPDQEETSNGKKASFSSFFNS